jgi:RNA 2',3'-cyclic 3'-phosphodiesterase
MSSKRLFIGVQINSSLQSDLKQVFVKLKQIAQTHDYNIRWSPEENWHITLQFLGNTEEALIPKLYDAIDEVARVYKSFKVRASGVSGFPEERRARVIYAGVSRTQELLNLQTSIEEATLPLGFKPEDREYSPHITLGRLRSAGSISDLISPFVRKKFSDFKLTELTLFESTLRGTFPHYEPLHRVKLQPEALME